MIPESRPKMLLFSHISNPHYVTGAEKLLVLFARELIRRYQCVLVVPREGVIAGFARSLGIPVIVFDIPLCTAMYLASSSVYGHLDAIRSHFAYQRLLALLVRERPSLVFVNTCVHPLPAVAAKSLGIPVVWGLMEMIQASAHRHLTLDIISNHSDAIAGISRSTLRPFRGHPGAAKTALLSPYIPEESWNPAEWPYHRQTLRQAAGWAETDLVVGFVAGAIYPMKGLEHFVRAGILAGKRYPNTRFLVVGNPVDESYFQHCRSLIHQEGMDACFGWIRFVEDVQRIYPALDLAVCTSIQPEGFGMTALEAMMFGKPVVAFASGGLEEILNVTGNSRFLVPAGNVQALADRIGELFSDEGLRRWTGEANAIASRTAYGAGVFNVQWDQLAARIQIPPAFLSPLIRAGKTVYLVEFGRRRPFVSEKAFLQRGFRFEDIRNVTPQELSRIPRGNPIREWPESAERRIGSRRRQRRYRSALRSRRSRRAKSGRSRKARLRGRSRSRSPNSRRTRARRAATGKAMRRSARRRR